MKWISILLFLAGLASAEEFSKQAMLRDIAGRVIVPAYQHLASTSQSLTNSIRQLLGDTNERTLDRAREAWRAALLAARRVQCFQSGPLVDRDYASTFFYWQVLPGRIEQVLQSADVIDQAFIDALGATSKGMFALEFLLFDRRPGESEASALALLRGPEAKRRREYLTALAVDIETKATQLADDWARSESTGAQKKFIVAGQDTVNLVVNQLAHATELLAENRVNFVMRLPRPIDRQLDRIEGNVSGTSLQSTLASLEGVKRVFFGGDGLGFEDYLKRLNPPLEKRIAEAFEAAASATSAMKTPLEQATVDNLPALEDAYEKLRALEILLKVDLASALGVTITFSSNDGD